MAYIQFIDISKSYGDNRVLKKHKFIYRKKMNLLHY